MLEEYFVDFNNRISITQAKWSSQWQSLIFESPITDQVFEREELALDGR